MVQYTEEERKMLERYELERDARNKAELEYYTLLNAAKKEGHEEGKAEIIKSMHDLGMSIEEIAKVCKLDIDYIREVLK
jgi:predicted transposase/invertase (TIGR01784 family)